MVKRSDAIGKNSVLTKTIVLPSGDQSGRAAFKPHLVSWRMPVPSGWTRNSAVTPSKAWKFRDGTKCLARVNTIQLPSGDHRGFVSKNPNGFAVTRERTFPVVASMM